jgi:serine/threonine-protein kinase/endoribonuclease IRE1
MQQIGSIVFNSNEIVGRGASSVVYKGEKFTEKLSNSHFRICCHFSGKIGNRDVAVKKVPKSRAKLVTAEIDLLEKSDRHPNIIRYYLSEEDAENHYIALELCHGTLLDFISDERMKAKITLKNVFDQLLRGMEFLHDLNIVHRDVKPTNVLLFLTSPNELTVKISDFGFAKLMDSRKGSEMSVVPDESSFWTVPEMAQGHYNKKSDVFSIGALIYFICVDGKASNSGKAFSFDLLNSIKFTESSNGIPLRHLITVMTRPSPHLRPSFKCLRFHPYFWDSQKVLNFLTAAADRIKISDGLALKAKNMLQENAETVIGWDWSSRLDHEVISSLAYRSRFHNYGTNSISELLRAIRNKAAHYDEMTASAKQVYGPIPEGFASYWTSKFPGLVMHVFLKLYRAELHSDPTFKDSYYPNADECNAARSS